MAKQYNASDEALGGIVELGVFGTLAGSVSSLPSAMVTVAVAASGAPIAVSLTGVAAVSAAAYVGFSFGKRVVKGINHGLNNNPGTSYSPGTNN